MCISPCNLSEVGPVACRYCWQCKANRVNDLVGRCIAEQKISKKTYAVTLTYRGDTPNAATLVYRDFQLFMKQLRNEGYKVRYIVAGEYGSKKGRAHWHAILFFKGKAPEINIDQRIDWKPWPHGFSYFQVPDYKGFAYVLKYVLKDQDAQVSVGHLAMSKKPPLGHDWFLNLADQYVKQKLAPQNAVYQFRDAFDSKGKMRKFWLQGRMREIFIDYFITFYRLAHGTEPPYSEMVEMREDEIIRNDVSMTNEEWRDMLAGRRYVAPAEPDPEDEEQENQFEPGPEIEAYIPLGGDRLAFRWTDGTIEIDEGLDGTWLVENANQLDALLQRVEPNPRKRHAIREKLPLQDGRGLCSKLNQSKPQSRVALIGNSAKADHTNQRLTKQGAPLRPRPIILRM